MKKNKLKYLIFILALLIANTPFNAFAEGNANIKTSISSENIDSEDNNNVHIGLQEENVILDGEIGEWNPNMEDAPDFDNVEEIEGTKPEEGDYFTISVTVPINMEFYVLPNSTLAFGSFYSPEYTIKNNGSKTIVAKINSFSVKDENETNINAPLRIEKVIGGDGRTQMELKMCAINNLDSEGNSKEVDLTSLDVLSEDEKILYELEANQIEKIKFNSKRWELPWFESKKETAGSTYEADFEFSVKE